MPPRRRRFGIYDKAALAPLRIKRRVPEPPLDLPVTEHRLYALKQVQVGGKVRWYPATGWRMDGGLCNALVRDLVLAKWVDEVIDGERRILVLAERGEQIICGR